MSKWKHQGIIVLNDKKFLFIPEGEDLFISNCYIDGIICNKEDYKNNYEVIRTINRGLKRDLIMIFLDELESPLVFEELYEEVA